MSISFFTLFLLFLLPPPLTFLSPVVLLIPILISHENFLPDPKWGLGPWFLLDLKKFLFLDFLLPTTFVVYARNFSLLFMSCHIVSCPVVSCPVLSCPPPLAVNDNNDPHRTLTPLRCVAKCVIKQIKFHGEKCLK